MDEFPLEVFNNIFPYLNCDDILNYIDISKAMRLVVSEYIKLLSSRYQDLILDRVIIYNNTKLLQFFIDLGLVLRSDKLCEVAARINNLNIIQWLYNNRNSKMPVVEIVKWIPHYGFDNLKVICKTATANGQIVILKWAKYNNATLTPDLIECAIEKHQIAIIHWLYFEVGIKLPTNSLNIAVLFNNLEFFRWVKEFSIEPAPYRYQLSYTKITVYSMHVKTSNLEMLSYLNEYVGPWDLNVWKIAINMGKLDVLTYLISRGYHLPISTCCYAYKYGNMEVIRWLIKNNHHCCFKCAGFLENGILT